MAEKKPFDAGDEKQVKDRKSVHKLAREQEIEELKVLLGTYGGRSFVWRVLSECGMYRAAPGNPYSDTRFEGGRDIGIWVVEEVFTSDPKAYTMMRNEANLREAKLKGKTNG